MRYSFAAAFICLAWQTSAALAYSCNDNHYVNSSGHVVHSPSCGVEPDKHAAECVDGGVSFSEHHVGLARITAASPTGIEAGADGAPFLPELGAGPENTQAELSRASSAHPTALVRIA
jgi:hypothetical protein